MKKGLCAILAIFSIFAMIMVVGCDTGGGDSPKAATKSSDASLKSIQVAGLTPITASRLGDANAAWASVEAGKLDLPNSKKDQAKVVPTATEATATFRYAVVQDAGAPTFGSTDTFDLDDGDIIYVEVTAPDETTKLIYALDVLIGQNTALVAIKIDDEAVTEMPTAANSVDAAEEALFLIPDIYNGNEYTVNVTLEDEEASVQFAVVAEADLEDTDLTALTFEADNQFIFEDDDILFIEVTAANGTTKGYYKLHLNFTLSAHIHYGSPVIDEATKKIDELWTTVADEEYVIKRFAPENSSAVNRGTYGVAKALWDEDGLYVYVRVYDKFVATADLGAHMSDSVEVFINEYWEFPEDDASHTKYGGQYRIGAHGTLTGDGATAVDAFKALGRTSAWLTTEATDGFDGYIVIIQCPWLMKDQSWGALKDNKLFGFEMQINDSTEAGNDRDGVYVWNNTRSQSYGHIKDYTSGELLLDGHELRVEAKSPTITTQPQSAAYDLGDVGSIAALTIVAGASPDDGVITYQWYSATSVTGAGTIITSATSATYTPTGISAVGNYYYYCDVTNTIDNGTPGYESKTISSARALIRITQFVAADQSSYIEKVTAQNTSYAIFEFNLPPGYTWGDFDVLTADYMLDAANLAEYNTNYRATRLMGPYVASDFTPVTDENDRNLLIAAYQEYNAPYILDGGPDKAAFFAIATAADTWFTIEYDISGTNKNTSYGDHIPASGDTGPFYFGVGLPNGYAGQDPACEFLVSNVRLTNTAGDKFVISTGSGFDLEVFAGSATDNNQDFFTRSIVGVRDDIGNAFGAESGNDVGGKGVYYKVGIEKPTSPAMTGNWAGTNFMLVYPMDFDWNDYSYMTVNFTMTNSATGAVISTGTIGTMKLFDSWQGSGYNPQNAAAPTTGPVLFSAYNQVGEHTTALDTMYAPPKTLRVEQGNDGTSYVVDVLDVIFHAEDDS